MSTALMSKFDIFIQGMNHYFEYIEGSAHSLKQNMQLGTPYLVDTSEPIGLNFNGMIRISGDYRGCIIFSASQEFLKSLLPILGEDDDSIEMFMDTVGEIANLISGSAKEELGAHYFVSAPFLSESALKPELFSQHDQLFVLPFYWRDNEAKLIMGLKAHYH